MKFKQLTGMPMYDNMITIEDREYFKENKNVTYSIVEMSPLDYLMKCTKGFSAYYNTIDELLDSRMSNYEKLLQTENLDSIEWNMPMLDYSKGFAQEGITRAMIAFKMEVETIPVMVVHRFKKYEKAYY